MTTRDRIYEVIEEEIQWAASPDLTNDTTWDDLGMDSLDRVELVIALEESFAIDIPDEEAERWEKVGHAVAYFEGLEEET